MKGRLKSESGFALVLTLVVTALMVAVVVEMIHQVYVDTSLSRAFRDGQQASILAQSGTTGAAQLLQKGLSGRSYTALNDTWALPMVLNDEVGSLEVKVSEENSKINLNALVQPNGDFDQYTLAALKRLCVRLNVKDDVWSAVADWIDSDDLPRSGGGESPHYLALKNGYSARNGSLSTVTELSLVKGVTAEHLARLRPYVTIFSDQAGSSTATVNINTAPKEILAAIDDRIDDRIISRIIDERNIQPFKSIGELARVPGMDGIVPGLVGKVSVKGNLFRINSVSRVKNTARTVEAVVRLSSGTPEFLSWQEF